MIDIRCLNCGSLLAFDDDEAGRAVACPDCSARLRVPTPLRAADDVAVVRLVAEGKWMLFDQSLPIYVDGKRIGDGSIKTGFDVTVELEPGEHEVEVGTWKHALDVPRAGTYEAEFAYSVAWGKITAAKVRRVDPDEANHWQEERGRPIDARATEGEISPEDEQVLMALDALQNQKAGWGSTIALLVVSLLLYSAAGGFQDLWSSLIVIVPVLFFHELGHYLAMLAFGYRNLRMFFIPFFGAAVSGQHYNVAGWKKALVALAGPVPGIAVGWVFCSVGIAAQIPLLVSVAMMLVIINGYNLLPMLPLDGGWVVHAVLFVRHPVLDVVFRVAAALTLLVLAILIQAWILGFVSVFMLIATPMAYRTARIARLLGREGLVTRSIDGRSIPTEAALRILGELRLVLPRQTHPNILAQYIANVFETFNSEPPGALASFALLFLYAAAFLAALVLAAVIATSHLVQQPVG